MKSEFEIGDKAHLSKGKLVKGIQDYDKEIYKNFRLKDESEVTITKVYKTNKELVNKIGKHMYDCEVEHKGIVYSIERLTDFDLIPKKTWSKTAEMKAIIEKLSKQ